MAETAKSGRTLRRGDLGAALAASVSLLALTAAGLAAAAEVPFANVAGVSGPTRYATADIDRDGDLDAFILDPTSGTIEWTENVGGGPLGTSNSVFVLSSATDDIVAGDVDGDGFPDLVVDDDFPGGEEILLFPGNGSGVDAGSTQVVGSLGKNFLQLALADMNGDGALDVAASLTASVEWHRNDGGGSWSSITSVSPASGQVDGFAVADIDRDGDLDIVTSGGSAVSWFENTSGNGDTFGAEQVISNTASGARGVRVADMDGDGNLDVLSAQTSADDVEWFANDGTPGGLGDWTANLIDGSFDEAADVATADLDRDGDLDVVAAADPAAPSPAIVWYENTDSMATTWSAARTLPLSTGGWQLAAGDFDGDGDADVLHGNASTGALGFSENQRLHAAALFREQDEVFIDTLQNDPEDVLAVDLDNDGLVDLVMYSDAADGLRRYLNNGNPPAVSEWPEALIDATGLDPSDLVGGDLDGDGDIDLVTTTSGDDTVAWHENNDPGGGASSWTRTALTTSADATKRAHVVDLDSDGDLDIVFTAEATAINGLQEIAWLDNDGAANPSFTQRSIDTAVLGPKGIASGDLDRDGDVDLVVSGRLDGTVNWFENDGATPPGWTPYVVDTQGTTGSNDDLVVADFDGDGDLDIVADVPADMLFFENQGGAPPTWGSGVDVGFGSDDLEAADVDADGDVDLLSVRQIADEVVFDENLGGGSWASHRFTDVSYGARRVDVADLDRDGDLDLVVANRKGDRFGWFPNGGGQLLLTTEEAGLAAEVESTSAHRFTLTAEHQGEPGEGDIELVTLAFRFDDESGTPLSTGQATALIDRMRVYLDNGNGIFQSGIDTIVLTVDPLSLAGGVQTLTIPDADANFQIAQGTPRVYHVVLELTVDAAVQSPNVFRMTQTAATAEDASHDLPASLAIAEGGDSGLITILAPGDDADGDGLSNGDELGVHLTDPFLADSDGDGLSDAYEINTAGTNPNSSDQDGDDVLDGLEDFLGSDPTSAGSTPTIPLRIPYAAHVILAPGIGGPHLGSGDIDRDGDLDLAGRGATLNSSAWYENTAGDASSWTVNSIAAGATPSEFDLADVDDDGDLDLVAPLLTDGILRWYDNQNGDGSSWVASDIGLTAGARSTAVVDLDGDGTRDVAAAAFYDGEVSRHLNSDGDGSSWTGAVISGVEIEASSVESGDLDGDGDEDLVSTAIDSLRLVWHENLGGAPTFATHEIADGLGYRFAAAADIDGDGDLDVISAAGGRVDWYENVAGDATFWAPHGVSIDDAPAFVEAVDLDQDGDLDLVADDGNGSFTSNWYENALGDGTIWVTHVQTLSSDDPHYAHAADLDGDGDLDLAINADDPSNVFFLENQTIHRSALFPTSEVVASGLANARSLASADIDSDGDADLVVLANFATGELNWYENDGGNPVAWSGHAVATGLNGDAAFMVAADLDHDGDQDLIAGHGGTGATDEILWYENDGAGGGWASHLIDALISRPEGLAASDLDGDGDLDVVAAGLLGGEFFWYENDGMGSGWTRRQLGVQSAAWHPAVGDVDADGDPDVVGCGLAASSNVIWFENDGSPQDDITVWTTRVIPTTGANARQCALGDLDRDGDLDLVVPFLNSNTVAWYESDGSAIPSFTEHVLGGIELTQPHDVSIVDLDQDGDLDFGLGAIDTTGVDISWWENDGAGGFTAHVVDDGTAGAGFMIAADLDGDGAIDLATGAPPAQQVRIYPNRGGQFAVPTTDTAYLGLIDTQQRSLFEIDAGNRGRSGDRVARFETLELYFDDGLGTPLLTAEASALLASLDIYLDDGDGVFQAGTDTLVSSPAIALGAGAQSIDLSGGGAAVLLAAGTSSRYFVVVATTATASAQIPNTFRVTHRSETGSGGVDSVDDLTLSVEFEADTSTPLITALDATGDSDSDGLINADELTEGTDPLNSDTDGDALSDGDEVHVHSTEPLNVDSDGDGLDDGVEVSLVFDPNDPDTDGDGYCDGPNDPGAACPLGVSDNCPADINPSQTNSDAFAAGDFCQCGNVDGVGGIDATDLQRAREFVVGRTLGGPFDIDHCDVDNDTTCGVADLFLIERATSGASVTLQDACAAYKGP